MLLRRRTSITKLGMTSENCTLWRRLGKNLLERYLGIPRPLLNLNFRLQSTCQVGRAHDKLESINALILQPSYGGSGHQVFL